MTGTFDFSIVLSAPRSRKSAPAATTRDAMCMTCVCATSEYEKTQRSTFSFLMSSSRESSGTIGMPSGYSEPASAAGYRRESIPGI